MPHEYQSSSNVQPRLMSEEKLYRYDYHELFTGKLPIIQRSFESFDLWRGLEKSLKNKSMSVLKHFCCNEDVHNSNLYYRQYPVADDSIEDSSL